MSKINIAIDGPSGVGKSSLSNRLAEKRNMIHLDTGAMYRCVALYFLEQGIDLKNQKAVKKALSQIHISFEGDQVFLNNKNVTDAIRTNAISNFTSKISSIPIVRAKMVELQRATAKEKNYIVDGRDIGTTVLPYAEVKIFLTASPKARAERRYNEYISKGIESDYETIYQDIVARDYQDMHRKVSPLKEAEDAHVIDTSDLTIEEVLDAIEEIIEKRL